MQDAYGWRCRVESGHDKVFLLRKYITGRRSRGDSRTATRTVA